MAPRLLDRQLRLLDHLTSSGAIFGTGAAAPLEEALHGLNPGLLRLEARFSHEKRMEKITALFPRTYRLLGAERPAIVRAFVDDFPPTDISRMENGRQFLEHLRAWWQRKPPNPSYLGDVAACEFAIARVRVGDRLPPDARASGEVSARAAIRRHPELVLVRCAYDIRPIIEDDAVETICVKRDTPLAIAAPPDVGEPRVFEIPPPVFDVLVALDDWTDRSELGTESDVLALVTELAQLGLLEVRGLAEVGG